MEENELEQSNSGETTEASSEPQTTTVEETGAEGQTTKANEQPEESKPFHEHPRFKELVEERNTFRTQYQQLQARLAQLERNSAPKPQQQEDQLISELKKIRPEFGERFEKLWNSMPKVEQFEQWQRQVESEKTRAQAMSTLQQLHTEHKVSPDFQKRYEREIRAIAAEDPNIQVSDLPKIYKQVHEEYTKLIDGVKRSEREAYVTDKKKDAAAPTVGKGKPAMPGGTQKRTFANQDEARQAMVADILKEARAAREQ